MLRYFFLSFQMLKTNKLVSYVSIWALDEVPAVKNASLLWPKHQLQRKTVYNIKNLFWMLCYFLSLQMLKTNKLEYSLLTLLIVS
jgi:hypothetical protein